MFPCGGDAGKEPARVKAAAHPHQYGFVGEPRDPWESTSTSSLY